MKKLVRPAILGFLAFSGGFTLPACEDDTMEEAGEELDEAAEEVEEEVEDIAD